MIPPGREAVIRNIRQAAERNDLNCKVEVDDPVFTPEQRQAVLEQFLARRSRPEYLLKNFAAGRALDLIALYWNRDAQIVGLEKLDGLASGAIITSNHFNPSENTLIRLLAQKLHKGQLCAVNQDTNLAMTGVIGFFMNYIDMIPINGNVNWMAKQFPLLLKERLDKKQLILMYPEQEMWFNYRKPRPCKRGAYYYAAKNNVPVISCFTEIRELPEWEAAGFHKTRYILHVLDPIYPDPTKSFRENSLEMCQRDYRQKVQAYEQCYSKPLTYAFSAWDIAGWAPEDADGGNA